MNKFLYKGRVHFPQLPNKNKFTDISCAFKKVAFKMFKMTGDYIKPR